MVYFLKRTTPSKKGLYLQIYSNFYDPITKTKKHKCYKTLGYVDDLINKGIKDPIAEYTKIVKEMNEDLKEAKAKEIGDTSTLKNLGYFLIKAIIDKLDIDKTVDILTSTITSRVSISILLRKLIYSQIVNPGSKLHFYTDTLKSLIDVSDINSSDELNYSYDQLLDVIYYLGVNYEKFIELFNDKINKFYSRNTDKVYFDCTNYYFEIDLEKDDKMKGPSKENRKSPIIGQALLLDKDRIPLGMMMYPGNVSETDKIREVIEDTKVRYNITGKTIQVADKALNCAKNIYAASVAANDGYIFSRSLKNRKLSDDERKWILEDKAKKEWKTVLDENGELKYKYKSYRGDFSYSFTPDEDDKTKKITFNVLEKRLITFNPSLAKKQRIEINKLADKAKYIKTIKEASKEDYGESIRYVKFNIKDENGKKIKCDPIIDEDKIKLDLALCGYNMIVTSEVTMDDIEIYNTYHGLSRIEESFRILKTNLESRPVYLQKKESIYGHFLICYLALTCLRLIEIKEFNSTITSPGIVNFIRGFYVTKVNENEFINNATTTREFIDIKKATSLMKLSHLNLSRKDIKNILDFEFNTPNGE